METLEVYLLNAGRESLRSRPVRDDEDVGANTGEVAHLTTGDSD